MKKAFIALFILIRALQCLAFSYTDENGVTWDITEGESSDICYPDMDTTKCCIFGVSNCGEYVSIPSVVYNGANKYTVTVIGKNLFKDNTKILKVTLPQTVKKSRMEHFMDARV